MVRSLEGMLDYDLYDILAELGYGMAPKTRGQRADAFAYKQEAWLSRMPIKTAAVIRAVAGPFARAGTEGLENPAVFQTPEVVGAGGLAALKTMGKPSEILMETKERMFEA
jgi:type I restriction enzyme R subunit